MPIHMSTVSHLYLNPQSGGGEDGGSGGSLSLSDQCFVIGSHMVRAALQPILLHLE